jgi:thiamine-phosphate pyrophosphorylase
VTLPAPPLLVITDRSQARADLETIAAAVFEAGGRWLSMREKDLPPVERLALATRLVALGRRHGAIVTVHGDLDAALGAGADGVHLPSGSDPAAARKNLGRAALIGVSAHSRAEAEAAAARGADYVTLSPIFMSASKPGYGPPLGIAGLQALVSQLRVPVIAVGGIAETTAADCLAAGAAGIAVMGLVMRAADPRAITAALLTSLSPPGRGSG